MKPCLTAFIIEGTLTSKHPHFKVSADCLPHLSTASEMEERLFSQLFSGDFSLLLPPATLNPNKAVLTVNLKSREVLCMLTHSTDCVEQ